MTQSKVRISPLITLVVVLASVGILLLSLQAAREIISPVILALVLAISITPIINWFMRKGAPGWLAFLLSLFIIYSIMLGLVWLITLSLQDFTASIPTYEQEFQRILLVAGSTLTSYGIDINSLIDGDTIIAPDKAMTLAADFAGELVAGLSNWGLILVTATFFLMEATKMPEKLRIVIGESGQHVQRIIRFNQDVRYFVSLSAGLGLVAAVLDVILLMVLGVDFVLLWGVFAFLMGFIPNIGIFLAIIPPAIMAYIQFGVLQMVVVVVGFLLINQLINSSIKTRFIRSRLNLSGLVIFLSLMLWGWVFGPIGAIVAVPIALLIQTILASQKETYWMAYIMGEGNEAFKPETEQDQKVLE